jgi:predicted porin
MNKKSAVALAVGALFAAPAVAQTGEVQIYGRVYPAFASFKASGATAAGAAPSNLVSQPTAAAPDFKQRYSVDSYNTRIGFRGREALGGGMNAIWQIEQRVQIDTGAGLWASRNSFVGLNGGFGTVKLGNFDTIYKEYGAIVSTFGISSGHFISTSAVLSDIGLNTNDSLYGDTGFHIRAPNSVMYETPSFGGFQAGIQYSSDEFKGNPGFGDLNTNLWSAGVKYEAGPLYLSAQYERHNDWFDGSLNSAVPNSGANPNSKDTGIRLSARYSITPAHRLMADISRLEWKEDGQGAAGEFDKYKKVTWDIGWEARWGGPWRTNLVYARADEGDCSLSGGVACSTSGLKASHWAATVAYDLSKRTFLYGALSRLSMGDSARFDNWTNGTPPRGADVTQWALGITHSF